MIIFRKIQIGFVAFFLWMSMSISSFAATPAISTNSIGLMQNNVLIAGMFRKSISGMPNVTSLVKGFDDIWNNSSNRNDLDIKFIDYCRSQKFISSSQCFQYLGLWVSDVREDNDSEEVDKLIDAVQFAQKVGSVPQTAPNPSRDYVP